MPVMPSDILMAKVSTSPSKKVDSCSGFAVFMITASFTPKYRYTLARTAAICSVLGLTGLAGGAAVAGCCAQMVGFAVMSFRENGWGGLVSQGLGTSMLQMPNIVKNPRIWIAPILTSAITGPIATCVFKMQMNGAAINSGMGTCGLCGPIGVWTGWISPSETALERGASAISAGAFDWLGLVLICIILPAVICPLLNLVCRKTGWVKEGDLKLD